MNKHIVVIQVTTAVLFIILLCYLFSVQVLDFSGYKKQGFAIRNTNNVSYRGDILDRNGIKLATDELIYEVYAHPTLYSEKHPPEKIAEELAPYLNISKSELTEKLTSKKRIL